MSARVVVGDDIPAGFGDYTVPTINPFFEDADNNTVDDDATTFGEVFAYGFRTVGTRSRVGLMTHGPCAGQWRDVVLLERRRPQTEPG